MISPLFYPRCRYTPTCSEYGIQSIKKYGAFNNLDILTELLIQIKKLTQIDDDMLSVIDGLLINYTSELESIYDQMTDKNKYTEKTYKKLKLKSKKTSKNTKAEAIKIEKLLEKIKKTCTKEPSHITIRTSLGEFTAGRKRKVNGSKKKKKSRRKHLKKTKRR